MGRKESNQTNKQNTVHLNYVYFQVDALTDSLEHMKEKYQSAQAEDRSMSEKMMTVERYCILET